MSFESDLNDLHLCEDSIISTILLTPKKDLNKNIFLEDNLFDNLFQDGEADANINFEKLKVKAREVGIQTDFAAKYKKKRLEFLKLAYETEITKPIKIKGFSRDFNAPEQYIVNNNGIFKYDYEVASYLSIFPHPVIVSERIININTGTEKNKVMFYDNGRSGDIIIDASTISTYQSIIQLRTHGIRVTSENAKDLVAFLADFISTNISKIPILRSTSRLGWEDSNFENFIPYDGNIIFDGEIDYKEMFEGIESKGDFVEWKEKMHAAFCNDITRVYVVSSFASVLIPLLKKLPFIVHLWGGSGMGKTVGLYAAMSVWGNPVKLCSTFNDTLVHTERKAGFMHNLPFAKNEGEVANQRTVTFTQFIYMFCEGKGKGRGNKSGGVDFIPTWDSIALTNAEQSLLGDDAKEGELNRVIDLCCDKPLFDDLPGTADFVKENYGFAGKEFVIQVKKWISNKKSRPLFKKYYDFFYEIYKANNEVTEKQIMAASIISLTDLLVYHFVFGMELQKAFEHTTSFTGRMCKLLKTKKEVDIIIRAYNDLTGWVSQNKIHFSVYDIDGTKSQIIPDCYGRILPKDQEGQEVRIISTVFNKFLKENNYPASKIKKGFHEKGLLRKGEKQYTTSTRINNIPVDCYSIKLM